MQRKVTQVKENPFVCCSLTVQAEKWKWQHRIPKKKKRRKGIHPSWVTWDRVMQLLLRGANQTVLGKILRLLSRHFVVTLEIKQARRIWHKSRHPLFPLKHTCMRYRKYSSSFFPALVYTVKSLAGCACTRSYARLWKRNIETGCDAPSSFLSTSASLINPFLKLLPTASTFIWPEEDRNNPLILISRRRKNECRPI